MTFWNRETLAQIENFMKVQLKRSIRANIATIYKQLVDCVSFIYILHNIGCKSCHPIRLSQYEEMDFTTNLSLTESNLGMCAASVGLYIEEHEK